MQHTDFIYKGPTHPRSYSCLLVVQAGELDLALLPGDMNIGLALQLDQRRLPSPGLFHHLVTGDRPFTLHLSSSPHPSLIEYIVLLLCSRNYISMDGSPLIVFNSPPSPAFWTTLEQQGWHTIACLVPDTERILTSQDQIPVRADRLIFQAHTMTEEFFFISGRDFLDTLSLEQSLDQYCHELLLDHPLLETWVLQRRQLQKKLDQLSSRNKVTEERLHNAEATIDIIRSKYKDDYDTLFNWYQQEYETLPRWYKQFGQLIKVMTGKRSLKSLLNTIRRRTHRIYDYISSTKKHVS
ncbi:MAG: hypothetical protein J0H07_28115 [Sphingobacteriales bacterium]|nr:hypothetical protein [Sphingobacteriales bacterium]